LDDVAARAFVLDRLREYLLLHVDYELEVAKIHTGVAPDLPTDVLSATAEWLAVQRESRKSPRNDGVLKWRRIADILGTAESMTLSEALAAYYFTLANTASILPRVVRIVTSTECYFARFRAPHRHHAEWMARSMSEQAP
jgi:hypothetical protein